MEHEMLAATKIEIDNLLASMPGHVYWLNSDNVYEGCNDNQARSFGLSSRHNITGKRNCDLIMDSQICEIIDKNNLAVIKEGKIQILEERAILHDGIERIYLSHKLPIFDQEQKVIGLLGISLDISEHKKYENDLKIGLEQTNLSLEHIVSNMPNHVYWKNAEGVYLGCNNRQAQTIGFRSGDEVIGKTDFDLPWGREAALVCRENDIRIMEAGASEEIVESAIINGKEQFFLSQKTCLKDSQGKVVGILGISVDITKQKETEKKLVEAKEIAEAANKLKSEFVQNMEHDIRTPFVGILGMTGILNDRETDPDKKEIIKAISACTQELLEYSCGILDFSQIEGGALPVISKKFNLIKLINSIEAIETPAAKMKKLDFTIECDDAMPKSLIGDEYRLKRILLNLLSNAIKFTEKGFVRLSIKWLKKDGRNVALRFIVEDSGIGIEQQKLNIIYERFSRLTPSNKGLYRGQGLGLRIVKQFVEDMDGDIEIRSVLAEGSCFTCAFHFKIPIIEED
jgi:two-component system aerobic respiration control sensor histidine kinase ArcB